MSMRSVHSQVLVVLAALTLLSACEMRSTTAVINANQAANQNGQPTRPAVANNQNGSHTVAKTVVANQTTSLGGIFEINPDCSVKGTATIRITQQPVHGTAAIAQRDDYPNYVPANPRSVCNKMKLAGVFIDYTPTPGFTGSDIATFEVISSNGADNEYRIILTVK